MEPDSALKVRQRLLKEELESETGITEDCNHQIYAREHHWRDESRTPVGAEIASRLDTVLAQASPWREPNDNKVLFPVPSLLCVIEGHFVRSPKTATQDRVMQKIRGCLRHSDALFRATHDDLTNLPNRAALIQHLDALLRQGSKAQSSSPDVRTSAAATVCVIAIDVDNFKRINDSWGHLYGDVALYTIARRLEAACQEAIKGNESIASEQVSRPGGEEFVVVVEGECEEQHFEKLAEEFRAAISDVELPTDEEAESLPLRIKEGLGSLPSVRDRRVSISLGLALSTKPKPSDASKIAASLRKNADAALYRAKSGGRNCVRKFSDILKNYGIILEHHESTQVVTIDIGRSSGVRTGQEFQVFHPDFDGQKAFLIDDGRNKKSIGRYPRRSTGRIVVFEAQEEISFCEVAENSGAGLFAPFSRLEIISVGSISRLQPRTGFFSGPQIPDRAEGQRIIDEAVRSALKKQVIAVGLGDTEALAEAHGTALVNDCLVIIHQYLQKGFESEGGVVGQVSQTEFYAIGSSEVDVAAVVAQVKEGIRAKSRNLAQVKVGIGSKVWKKREGDESSFEPKRTLDYAQYALACALRSKTSMVHFSPQAVTALLTRYRDARRFQDILADYSTLINIGIRHAGVENQAGLAALLIRPPDFDLAVKHFSEALRLSPQETYFKANLALTYARAGQAKQSLELFTEIYKSGDFGTLSVRYSEDFANALYSYCNGENLAPTDDAMAILGLCKERALKDGEKRTAEHIDNVFVKLTSMRSA